MVHFTWIPTPWAGWGLLAGPSVVSTETGHIWPTCGLKRGHCLQREYNEAGLTAQSSSKGLAVRGSVFRDYDNGIASAITAAGRDGGLMGTTELSKGSYVLDQGFLQGGSNSNRGRNSSLKALLKVEEDQGWRKVRGSLAPMLGTRMLVELPLFLHVLLYVVVCQHWWRRVPHLDYIL